jgi:asparagine synthase (glutamine-hydrolysing)
VDTALSLPDSAKLGDVRHANPYGQTYRETGAKRVLIDVGRRWLPPDFDVQPKRGFAMPFGAWLRGPLSDVLDDTLSLRSARNRGLLDSGRVTALRERFRRGDAGWAEPWLLMMIELWCRAVLDVAARGNAPSTSAEPNADRISEAVAPGVATGGVA